MSKPLYITTTLPYVNADPHIGFALEIVQADIVARYWRGQGREVFFNTGTDEHGQKIFEAAQKAGQDVKTYVDYYANEFKKLADQNTGLNLSNNAFVRTTDKGHEQAAQEIWRRCQQKGDIEKRQYSGQYCVGCELYKSQRDLDDQGRCPLHPTQELITLQEENYFFKLSNYQDALLDYLKNPEVILPDWRRQEAVKFVEAGLEDFSVSRERAKLEWGIPVPHDTEQVMYVWFDALTNYISTLGWPNEDGNFNKFWQEGETVQLAGKDQVRFQSLMWQAMLMSAGIKNTDKVIYHGFITSGGQKMSKSLGNVINPLHLAKEYGADAVRYFLARQISPFDDSDVTLEKFKEVYNADLANGLGNLVSRVLKMSSVNNIIVDETVVNKDGDKLIKKYKENLESYNLNFATEAIWEMIAWSDRSIQSNEPFKKIKSINPVEVQEARDHIKLMLGDLLAISNLLLPIMPETAEKIMDCIRTNKMPTVSLFPRKD